MCQTCSNSWRNYWCLLLLLLWSMLHSNCPALFQAVGMHHSSWGYCFKRHSIGGKTCISILKWSNFGWFGGSPWVPHVRKPPILWYSYPIGWAVLRCKCLRRWVLSWSSLLSADGATGPVHWVQWYPMISLYWNTNNHMTDSDWVHKVAAANLCSDIYTVAVLPSVAFWCTI